MIYDAETIERLLQMQKKHHKGEYSIGDLVWVSGIFWKTEYAPCDKCCGVGALFRKREDKLEELQCDKCYGSKIDLNKRSSSVVCATGRALITGVTLYIPSREELLLHYDIQYALRGVVKSDTHDSFSIRITATGDIIYPPPGYHTNEKEALLGAENRVKEHLESCKKLGTKPQYEAVARDMVVPSYDSSLIDSLNGEMYHG